MRFSSPALALLAAAFMISHAHAQTGPAMKEDTGSTVNTQGAPGLRAGEPANPTLAPEQRTRIKRYVTENRVSPADIGGRVVVGTTLPATVELRTVPTEWGPNLSTYRYVYFDNHVVLVEPASRRVVQVID